MEINYKRIGRQIAARRKELGYRQSYVEELAGLSDKYLSSIETGRSIPSLETLVHICEVLSTTPDHLLVTSIIRNQPEQKDHFWQEYCYLTPKEQQLVRNFVTWLKEQEL